MKKKLSFFVIIIYIVNIVCFPANSLWAAEDYSDAQAVEYPAPPEVHGESAILMEADTGAILYEKNCHEKLYPASITKIMTGLLTIENCSMEDMVEYSGATLSELPFDAAKLGLVSGEKMSVKDSLYALLLRSCNDVAVGLAVKIAGSEEEFAKLMNEQAKKAGALDTNFVNSTGLHDENHYTTAYDMAMITKSAMNNPIFSEISGSDRYVLSPTNKCELTRTQVNRHEMLQPDSQNYYSYAVAGKTGYTDEAGRTLVTVAKRDGKTLICVFMNTTDEYVYNDSKLLFEYGFNHFDKVNISENEERFNQNGQDYFVKMSDIFINNGSLFVLGKSDYAIVPEGVKLSELPYKIEYVEDNSAGVIAEISYYCNNLIMGTTTVNVGRKESVSDDASPVRDDNHDEEVKIANIPINIWIVVMVVLVLIAIIFYIVYLVKTKEKRKRKRERKKVFKESKKRFKRRKKMPIKFK